MIGLIATQPAVQGDEYGQDDVIKYQKLRRTFSEYVKASDEWVASFHGAGF